MHLLYEFSIDDFIIINDYRRTYGDYAVLSHKIRFPVSNVLLFGCNVIILQNESNVWILAIGAIQVISLLISSKHLTTMMFGEKIEIDV